MSERDNLLDKRKELLQELQQFGLDIHRVSGNGKLYLRWPVLVRQDLLKLIDDRIEQLGQVPN